MRGIGLMGQMYEEKFVLSKPFTISLSFVRNKPH
jgi:hypothetical protein